MKASKNDYVLTNDISCIPNTVKNYSFFLLIYNLQFELLKKLKRVPTFIQIYLWAADRNLSSNLIFWGPEVSTKNVIF